MIYYEWKILLLVSIIVVLVVFDMQNQRVIFDYGSNFVDCVISGSWDGSICFWNANERSLSKPNQSISIRPSISPSAKIYSMDIGEK